MDQGELLGDFVGRNGRWPNGERVQAIQDFPVIYDKTQLQQFLGCTNWVRWYLVHVSPLMVKMIRHFLKPSAVFPKEGLGGANTEADRVVGAIKALRDVSHPLSSPR